MKVWQRLFWVTAVILLGAWSATNALAVTVSGRSSSEIEWFDDAREDTAVPAYEYLLLTLRDMDNAGLDFRGYGRLADDLNNEVDVDSRLYYAYVEKKNLLPHLDVKLGRQFIATTAGASIMDGLSLNYRDLGPFKLSLFGGGDVAYYEGYNAKDLIDGVELSGHFFDSLDLGISYLQKWEESELTHELIGVDADYDYQDLLNLFAELQYSYLIESVSYFNGGFVYHRNPLWSLRGDYLYSLPVFSSTNIYSVFAADTYREVSAEVDYRLDEGLRLFGVYTRELYEGSNDDANVVEAGVEKIRTDRFSGYLSGVWRDAGDGQDQRGVKARAAYLFHRYAQAGVGAEIDVLERRLTETDETTSSRVWADVTGYVSKRINVEAKVERGDSDLWDQYYRGRVRLNILF